MSKVCCSDWNRTSYPCRVIPRRSTIKLQNNRLDTPQKIMRKMRNAHAVVDCLRQSLGYCFVHLHNNGRG